MEAIAHLGLLEDDAIGLDAAALEIAALDHPGIALDPYVDLLGDLTRRLVTVGGDVNGPRDRAGVLACVIGGEYGFTGDRDAYDNPDNADMIRVIDRRRGLPVSLAIVHVAAARRLGWQADVLNTPGHVLVQIGSAVERVLIDPFDGGAVVDNDALAALLSRMLGAQTVPGVEHLQPMANRAVLVRLLTNQAARAETAGDTARALTVYRRMTVIAPAHVHGWWDRARLELATGAPSDSRSSLSAMLEVTRDPTLRAHAFSALDALASR